MTSPICTVKNGAGSPQTVTAGYATVTAAATVTIQLADLTGVSTWSIECIGADETTSASTTTSALSINSTTKTATFTAGTAGKSYIFRSIVNGGVDVNGTAQPTWTTTFKIGVPTAAGYIVGAVGETLEHSSTYGATGIINQIIRATAAPAGGVGIDIIAPLLITGATSSSNVDGTLLTLPADLLASAIIVKVTQAMVGAGSIVLSVGTSAGGQQFLLNQTINSGTAVGTRYGIATAQLGASFDSAKSYNAELASGSAIVLRLACTAVISTPVIVQARIFGAYV